MKTCYMIVRSIEGEITVLLPTRISLEISEAQCADWTAQHYVWWSPPKGSNTHENITREEFMQRLTGSPLFTVEL